MSPEGLSEAEREVAHVGADDALALRRPLTELTPRAACDTVPVNSPVPLQRPPLPVLEVIAKEWSWNLKSPPGELSGTGWEGWGREYEWEVDTSYHQPPPGLTHLYLGMAQRTKLSGDVARYRSSDAAPVRMDAHFTDPLDEEEKNAWYDRLCLRREMQPVYTPKLGENPIVLLFPMRFRMRDNGKPGAVWQECTLLQSPPQGVYTERPWQQKPKYFEWPWLAFWQAQLRFWTRMRCMYPELIAIGSDHGVAVNRYVYRRLSERHTDMWAYKDNFVGGYVNPRDDEVRTARWTYGKIAKPYIP